MKLTIKNNLYYQVGQRTQLLAVASNKSQIKAFKNTAYLKMYKTENANDFEHF